MCSCAPLPHPPFKPAPAPSPHPNLNPKPNAASGHGPTLLRCALVARAAARDDPPPAPSSFDFLALKRELEEQEEGVVAVDAAEGGGDEVVKEEDGEREPKTISSSGRRTGRQMARRSGLLAKQVISVSSARSLGFVSQLWVDASSVRAPPPCTCFRLANLSDVTLASSLVAIANYGSHPRVCLLL